MNTDEHGSEELYLTAGTDRVADAFGGWSAPAGHVKDRAQTAFYPFSSVSIRGSSLALETR